MIENAPAKINLSLHVLQRLENGYHALESLVSFTSFGDEISVSPPFFSIEDWISAWEKRRETTPTSRGIKTPIGGDLFTITGEFSAALLFQADDNIVIKSIYAFAKAFPTAKIGFLTLKKNLPIASGIGGGSSDAAATLRLLARLNDVRLDHPVLWDMARGLGADVPVCLEPCLRFMRGIGHKLSEPISGSKRVALLINPKIELETRRVFDRLGLQPGQKLTLPAWKAVAETQIPAPLLADFRNDLETPAEQLQPVIGTILRRLRASIGCELVRMSGSGASVFALFPREIDAIAVEKKLKTDHPEWWVCRTELEIPEGGIDAAVFF